MVVASNLCGDVDEINKGFYVKHQLKYELDNHPKFSFYVQTTHFKNALQEMIFEKEHPENNLIFPIDDPNISNAEGYRSIIEDFFERNEIAKKLGYLESLCMLDLVCDIVLNSKEKIDEEEIAFFDFNPLSFYKQFLKID